jgi:hypothetical protein
MSHYRYSSSFYDTCGGQSCFRMAGQINEDMSLVAAGEGAEVVEYYGAVNISDPSKVGTQGSEVRQGGGCVRVPGEARSRGRTLNPNHPKPRINPTCQEETRVRTPNATPYPTPYPTP